MPQLYCLKFFIMIFIGLSFSYLKLYAQVLSHNIKIEKQDDESLKNTPASTLVKGAL